MNLLPVEETPEAIQESLIITDTADPDEYYFRCTELRTMLTIRACKENRNVAHPG